MPSFQQEFSLSWGYKNWVLAHKSMSSPLSCPWCSNRIPCSNKLFSETLCVWKFFSNPCSDHDIWWPMWGFSGGTAVKNLPACKRRGFDPWVGKIPWRRKWPPTPVFLPGKSHGRRSLAGYGPWGHRESDTTEWLNNSKSCEISCQPSKFIWITQINKIFR